MIKRFSIGLISEVLPEDVTVFPSADASDWQMRANVYPEQDIIFYHACLYLSAEDDSDRKTYEKQTNGSAVLIP